MKVLEVGLEAVELVARLPHPCLQVQMGYVVVVLMCGQAAGHSGARRNFPHV